MKVALVTGASKGIGAAVARALAQDGYSLGLISRNRGALKSLAAELTKTYQTDVAIYDIDVSNGAMVEEAVKDLHCRLGRVDLLFNNAAINIRGTLELTHSEFDQIMRVNVQGAFNVLRAVAPIMKQQRAGYIFNVASVAGKTGFAGSGAYCGTKFALLGLSEALFHELVPLGIKVTALCPSWVDTEMASYAPFARDYMINPEDIARTVRYLQTLSPYACPKEVVLECVSDYR